MGATKPDNVPMLKWRSGCETVGQMIERNWLVITRCTRCRTEMRVPLKAVVRVRGRNFSLWNRRPRCLVVGCGAPMIYRAMPPGCSTYHDLEAEWPHGAPPPGTSGYWGPGR